MVAQQRDTFGIQFIDAARAVAAVANQAGLLQHTQVLRNCGPRNRKAGSQFVNCTRVIPEQFENRQAGGIAQGGKARLYVSAHLR